MAWYGPYSGPSGTTRFRVCIDMRTSSQNETQGFVQVRRWVEATGSFYSTRLATTWAGNVYLYDGGTYADSGWQDVGWVTYGASVSASCNANYTGGSGAYYSSAITGTYSPAIPTWAPKAPTSVTVTRANDRSITVKWVNNSTTARRYASINVQRSTDGGGWANIRTGLAANTSSYTDTSTAANHYYRYRVISVNGAGSGTSAASAYVYNTPASVTNVINTRNSDTKNTVTWRLASTTALLSSILVRRQIDGGAWADLATCAASATSYADTTTSPNHSYRYAVIPRNAAGSAAAAYSGHTYNTPAAPTSITMARKAETTVTGTVANPAKTATALEIQRSPDAASWVTINTISGIVTTFDDNPGGGTFYYRARNTRGALVSAWTQAASAVVTIAPPSAPTLLDPANSSVVSASLETYIFRWSHNPIDGSAQTKAEVELSDDGEAWTTHTVEGDVQQLELTNTFALNSQMRWRVRTKGAHEDFSPWSATGAFSVYQVPTCVIAEPPDGYVITQTPVSVALDYSDPSGTLAAASLKVLHDGETLLDRDIGAATEHTITAAEWLPVEGETYAIEVACRSTSTLQCSATRTVTVRYAPPRPVMLGMKLDEETGYVRLSLYEGADNDLADIARVSIFRIVGDERVLLAEDALNELDVIDRYAPINREYAYEAVSFAESGATNTRRYTGTFRSPYTYLYFDGGMARAKFDPEESISLTRPNAVENYYAGRRWPVSYDGENMGDERTYSAFLMTDAEALSFRALMEAGGRCVYKGVGGDVFHAKCSVSLSPEYTNPNVYGTVEVSLKRIDGRVL